VAWHGLSARWRPGPAQLGRSAPAGGPEPCASCPEVAATAATAAGLVEAAAAWVAAAASAVAAVDRADLRSVVHTRRALLSQTSTEPVAAAECG
jgi:hypothetical protein